MARIDLPENYAVRQLRSNVRDSLMSHGEEVVLLHTFHVNEDQGTVPRCPECYDDLYEASDKNDCGTCYGTTFSGGIKDAKRAWAIFTDASDDEVVGKRGVWHPVKRNLHTEYTPDLWQHDFVVRVTYWSDDHRPQGVEGIYVCDSVTNESLRTGNRPGNTRLDNVGQRADLQRISEQMPIYKLPIVGVQFNRQDDAISGVDTGIGGVALKTYDPTIINGEGPPSGQVEPGTIYVDTLTGDIYEWES